MKKLIVLGLALVLGGCAPMATFSSLVHDHCDKPLAERLLKREAVAMATAPHRVTIHCYEDG